MGARLVGGNVFRQKVSELSRRLAKPQTLRVGFLEGKTGPDGKPIAMRAAINNYGAPRAGIPPRPFFTNMVKDEQNGWPLFIAQALKASNYSVDQTLDLTGQHIEAQLQQSIIDTNSPPLSPITVMLRGMKANDTSLVVTGRTVGEAARRVAEGKTNYGASDKPLVEHGDMLRGTGYEVKK